jgi:hypothetical protein
MEHIWDYPLAFILRVGVIQARVGGCLDSMGLHIKLDWGWYKFKLDPIIKVKS